MRIVTVTNVEWDTDGEEDVETLPTTIDGVFDNGTPDGISDWLSEEYGWAVKSFRVVDEDALISYFVAYNYGGDSELEYFSCWADNPQHALEQCKDAAPDATWWQVYAPVK